MGPLLLLVWMLEGAAWDGAQRLEAALALERGGDSAAALAALDALAARELTWELPRLEAARLRLERGEDLETAARLLEQALALAPQSPRAHYLTGLLALERGQSHEALLALERALARREDYEEARQRAAGLALDAGDWLKAEHHFRALVRRDPASLSAGLGLARALEAQGRLEDAERELRRLLVDQPTSGVARRRLADLLERAGRTREAERLRQEEGRPPPRRMRPLRPSRR
jgi:tetratricopeptide (TPR) repeat protein